MLIRALPFLLLLPLTACSNHQTANGSDAGHAMHDGAQSAQCDGTADTYTQGLERLGAEGRWGIRFVSADPAPPDRGLNTLRVELVAGSMGTEGVQVSLVPFMPQHDHGTSPPSFEAADAGDGTLEIGPVDLFMPGNWRLTFEITDGTVTDEVVFNFCLEG